MILRAVATVVTTFLAGAAFADTCQTDFDFVAPQGHTGREASVTGLTTMFKAGAAKDEAAFMATAADPYIQHSPDLADGMKLVFDLLTNRPDGFSSKSMEWLGEGGYLDNGNYLVMFREVNRGDGTAPSKIFDLLYFDDDGKYAEHWDMRQSLSKETASGRSETATAKEFTANPTTYDENTEETNRRLAASFLNLAFNGNQLETALNLYVSPTYVQHNPQIADGTQPVIDIFNAGKIPSLCYDIKFVLAQNDLVWVYSKVTSSQGVAAVVDMFRVRDGQMVEHWDVVQPVPADADMPHKNGMF